MSRLTPTSLFNEIFPDRKDPQNPGHYLCRFCGKPTIDTRRYFYCGDACYNLCQKAVSWLQVRRLVWERDKGKCVRCGNPVKLYDGWHKEGKGDGVAACHHVVYVSELWRVAYDAVFNDDWSEIDKETKSHWYAVFYTILYLDMNNLITLCTDCHKMIHAADLRNQALKNPFKIARTKWNGFWDQVHQLEYTRTLEDFLVA